MSLYEFFHFCYMRYHPWPHGLEIKKKPLQGLVLEKSQVF